MYKILRGTLADVETQAAQYLANGWQIGALVFVGNDGDLGEIYAQAVYL